MFVVDLKVKRDFPKNNFDAVGNLQFFLVIIPLFRIFHLATKEVFKSISHLTRVQTSRKLERKENMSKKI